MTVFLLPPHDGGNAWKPEDLEAFRLKLEGTLGLDVAYRSPDGKITRRVRVPLRVRAQGRIDRTCAWLCEKGMLRTARVIWRCTGSQV